MSLLKDGHKYSYSQLSSFSECKFGYYLKYVEDDIPEQSNAFAEQGTLIHDILDQWAKGKLKKDQLADEYRKRYSNVVVSSFPRILTAKGYAEKAYQLGIDYFENFDEFPGYEIVSAEEQFDQPLKLTDGTERPFIAFVDLVLRDEFTGGLVVVDHKSKSLKEFKKHRDEMYKQQYLYSYFIHEKYGEWPETVMFNLFKESGYKDSEEFSMDKFNETMEWATKTINKIESCNIMDWLECKPQKNGIPDMMCAEICSVRGSCPNSIRRR